jgi:hypothetical protein
LLARSNSSRQAGFGAVLVITIIIAIVLIAGVGATIYKRSESVKQNSANTASTSGPTVSVSPQTKNTEPTPTQPAQSDTTLSVREWGLRLYLPASFKDAYYIPAIGNENMMFIGLASLDNEKCKATGNTASQMPVATLLRLQPEDRDPVSGELYTDQYKHGRQIGDFYYVYSGWQRTGQNRNVCGSDSRLSEIDKAFNAAINTAKATTSTPALD